MYKVLLLEDDLTLQDMIVEYFIVIIIIFVIVHLITKY